VALARTGVSEERFASIVIVETISDPFHSDDGGGTSLQNVSSYKSHKTAFFALTTVKTSNLTD
jgi:hypothetical protein